MIAGVRMPRGAFSRKISAAQRRPVQRPEVGFVQTPRPTMNADPVAPKPALERWLDAG